MSGYPWREGDVLTAADLNAAFQLLSSSPVTAFNGRVGQVNLSSADVTGALGYTPVRTVAGRTGNVVLTSSDLNDWSSAIAALAPLNSPHFIGTPTALTAALGTATGQLATTAFVGAAITAAGAAAVSSVAGRTGTVTLAHTDITDWNSATASFQQWNIGTVSSLGAGLSLADGVLSATGGGGGGGDWGAGVVSSLGTGLALADGVLSATGGGGGGGDWGAGVVSSLGTGLLLTDGVLAADIDVLAAWEDIGPSISEVGATASAAKTVASAVQTAITPLAWQTGIIIPFYQYVSNPYDDADFSALLTLIRANPTVPVIVVVNQAGDGGGGPGPYDVAMAQTIRMLQASGAAVAGYVSTINGTRDQSLVEADINAWRSLYLATPLEAVFFDQMPYDAGDGGANIALYSGYYSTAHNAGYKLVIANPGTLQLSEWYDARVADIYCCFEGNHWPAPADFSITPPSYLSGAITDYPVRKFAGLIYSSAWDQAAYTALQPYLRWIYATDSPSPADGDNPWAALPTYLSTLFAAAAAQNQQWQAGLVTSLGSGLTLTDGTLDATGGGAVTSVATRTGDVTLTHSDLTDWASATSSFLTSAPVSSVAGRTGAVTLAVADVSGAAPLASPTFTGSPTVPGYLTTASAASTYAPLASPTFTGSPTVPGYLTTASAASTYAPLASPTFTGSVTVPGGTINGTSVGATTASTGRFTTVTSTVATGTAPLTVASTTNVANLNASSLNGATFAAPGAIGGSTPGSGSFTTLAASSTVSGTGFSTYLASPPAIGGSAAAAGSFTTLAASSTVSGTGFSTYLASPPAIGGSAAAAGSFTTLSASSTVSGTGFSTYLASPPAIGGSAAAAGTFTNLTASGTVSGAGFTAVLGAIAAMPKVVTGQSLWIGMPSVTQGTAQTMTANRFYTMPVFLPAGTPAQFAVYMSTATLGGSARWGIYSDAGGPGTLLYDAGAFTITASSGLRATGAVSGAPTLAAGWYWLAVIFNAAINNLSCPAAATFSGPLGVSSSLGTVIGALGTQTYGALPSSPPTLTWQVGGNAVPLLLVSLG